MSRESHEVGPPPERAAFVGTRAGTKKRELASSHRERTLEETVERAERAARLAGVTRVGELTGLDRLGIPSFTAARPDAAPGHLTVTGGRGSTPLAARVSALLEAVEHHCGERQGRVGHTMTLADASRAGPVLDPVALILDRESEYLEESPLEWWWARDLLSGEAVQVPAAAVLCPHDAEPFLFAASSNGLACGNSLPEALRHGLLEVLENDANSFCAALKDGARLDLDGVQDEECRWLIARFLDAGIEVTVRVVTSAVELPLFYVISDDVERQDAMLISGGFGLDLDPVLALRRALTEAAMSRAVIIAGVRDDLAEAEAKRIAGYDVQKERMAALLERERPPVALADMPSRATDSIAGDLEWLAEAAGRAKFERVLAVDLTLPGFDFHVIRAIVPGAELSYVCPTRIGPRLAERLRARRA